MSIDVLGNVDVFYVDPDEPTRVNRVVNWTVFNGLVASLKTGGWDGPPVVVILRDDYEPPIPPLALTGSHRLAASEEVGIPVPCVDIYALCASRGVNLNALLDEWLPEEGATDAALLRAIGRVLGKLPIWLVIHYGINLIFCSGSAEAVGHRHLCNLDPEHYLEDDGFHECVVCGDWYRATSWA